MTWRSAEELKIAARDASERFLRGMIRRMAITLTDGTLWRLLGKHGGTGDDETPELEQFPGIGFYARPPATGNPEAIVLAVGGAKHRVIVATRDEKTRQAVAAQLAEGETAVYNDKAIIVVKANSTVEIRLVGGAIESTLRGETYRSAEDTLLTALQALCAALVSSAPPLGTLPQQAATVAAATAAATAVTTFQAAAATYLTTVLKTH